MTASFSRARARVNLSAIARNYRRLTACGVPVMGVVKADAYGHGAVEIARTLRADGADWLGVALLSEAVQLRAAGDRGRMLAWLWAPGDPALSECLELDVDVSVSSEGTLAEVDYKFVRDDTTTILDLNQEDMLLFLRQNLSALFPGQIHHLHLK